jgi:RNA-directed DNA polymerase
MKIEQEHIDSIRFGFANMQTKEDFLYLLNQAKPLVYGDNSSPFALNQLTWYANTKINKNRYRRFTINKKSGSKREIHAPYPGLKAIQKTLSFVLQCVYEPHVAATGFVRNKSIVDNAKLHEGNLYVYNLDLKDFFPSIDQARIWKVLQLKPFNLNLDKTIQPEYLPIAKFKKDILQIEDKIQLLKSRKTGWLVAKPKLDLALFGSQNLSFNENIYVEIRKDSFYFKKTNKKKKTYNLVNEQREFNRIQIANMIAALCCTELEVERFVDNKWTKEFRSVLPQGAPTSPVLSNIVCQKLDFLLAAVAKRFGLKYSRYADDITFSSMHNVYQPESEFLKELNRIIAEQNFHIKESKTRLQKDGYRKEVTGLLVNEKANVQQRYIKQLRMWLYYWERYGYERASGFFLQQYIADNGHVKNGKPDMANVISGKLDYLKMVKGAENELYQKLKAKFEKITGKATSISKNLIEVEEAEISNTPLIKLLPGLKKQPIVLSEEKIMYVPPAAKTDENTIPVFHKPKELVALLKNFSVNDSALKYTTHSWDAGRDANMFKDLSGFLKIAESQYRKFSFHLNSLSKNLHGKINTFLFDKEIAKKGWGDINPKKRIYFGWSSPELLEACNDDISLNPEDYILPEKYQVQRAGKTLQKFKHIIDVFKNEIEVRDENSALLNLILQKHDHYLISFSAPKVSNLENKTFYTDIQWLGKALDLIFEGIQKYPQHPVAEYAVTESNNDRLILTILHRNSFKNGLSIHDDKLNLKRGDFSTIKDKLKNLCDWCIESEFAEGAYRINYLVSDNEIPAYEKIMSAEGFKHILTFYK